MIALVSSVQRLETDRMCSYNIVTPFQKSLVKCKMQTKAVCHNDNVIYYGSKQDKRDIADKAGMVPVHVAIKIMLAQR